MRANEINPINIGEHICPSSIHLVTNYYSKSSPLRLVAAPKHKNWHTRQSINKYFHRGLHHLPAIRSGLLKYRFALSFIHVSIIVFNSSIWYGEYSAMFLWWVCKFLSRYNIFHLCSLHIGSCKIYFTYYKLKISRHHNIEHCMNLYNPAIDVCK